MQWRLLFSSFLFSFSIFWWMPCVPWAHQAWAVLLALLHWRLFSPQILRMETRWSACNNISFFFLSGRLFLLKKKCAFFFLDHMHSKYAGLLQIKATVDDDPPKEKKNRASQAQAVRNTSHPVLLPPSSWMLHSIKFRSLGKMNCPHTQPFSNLLGSLWYVPALPKYLHRGCWKKAKLCRSELCATCHWNLERRISTKREKGKERKKKNLEAVLSCLPQSLTLNLSLVLLSNVRQREIGHTSGVCGCVWCGWVVPSRWVSQPAIFFFWIFERVLERRQWMRCASSYYFWFWRRYIL